MIEGMISLILACALGPTLDQKIAGVLPTSAEDRWLQIPWRTSIMKARLDAQATGKPLFLWIMNGSPVGCT
jgi:hypothetical protein